jgi:hypothetical protein
MREIKNILIKLISPVYFLMVLLNNFMKIMAQNQEKKVYKYMVPRRLPQMLRCRVQYCTVTVDA